MCKRTSIAVAAFVLAVTAAAALTQETTIVVFGNNITAGMSRDEVKAAMQIPPDHEDEVKGLTYKREFQKLENATEWAGFVFSREGTLTEVYWQLQITDLQSYSPTAAEKVLEAIFFLLKASHGKPSSAEKESGKYGRFDWYASDARPLSIDYDYWLGGKEPGAKILYSFK